MTQAAVNVHEDDKPLINWALANGWHFLMHPKGIPLITKDGLSIAFAVEPRLTEAGRITINRMMTGELKL